MSEHKKGAPAGPHISDLEVIANDTAALLLQSAAFDIDMQLGDGYATKHPVLLAGYLQASALVYLAERIAERMEGRQHG